MAFDGGFLHKIIGELNSACDCHIDKIYQPTRDELVFLLRKKGFTKKLLITVKSGSARLNFTENKYENPATPPNFCMLLRKYLSTARLISVTQPSLERVAELTFSSLNELGDTVNLRLVCELIGNQANVVLVKEDGRIIDALRHSDVETAKRLILPGAVYEYPATQQKLNPLLADCDEICDRVNSSEHPINKTLLGLIDGFSPLVCREIEYLTENEIAGGKEKITALKNSFSYVLKCLKAEGVPTIVFNTDGAPVEYSYINISQYGSEFSIKQYESYSALLDAFYTTKDTVLRIQSAAHDIIKLVNNLKARTEKKLSLRLIELEKCKDRDTFRIYGELLKANLYNIPNGSITATVQNYYDENMAEVTIPLNPALTPAKNAEKYFKDYKKTYTAEQTLTALTVTDRQELVYFDSVLDSISRCTTLAEISEIREELSLAGYIKRPATQRKKNQNTSALKEYISKEGYRIVVGKNNIQNDYITTRLANKNDIWFHVKNIAGSHVVVFCDGQELSDETLLFAATLAAENSKAADSSQVPVDYTHVKFVKKPSGAKPGMVIYTTNKTVYVTPRKAGERE